MFLFKSLSSFIVFGVFLVESKIYIKNATDTKIEKITGGSLASIERFPYLVFITSGRYICGGSIISENHILTAAHCVCKTNRLIHIHTGSEKKNSGGIWTVPDRIICHENYDKIRLRENDVAILVLGTRYSLKFYKKMQSIPLADHEPEASDWGYVSGWGSIDNNGSKPEEMRIAAVEVLEPKTCRSNFWLYSMPGSFCAGTKDGRDACYGDSGGPLVIKKKLSGIVSSGPIKCGTNGLYMSVAYYKKWIEQKMAEPIPEGANRIWTKLWDRMKG